MGMDSGSLTIQFRMALMGAVGSRSTADPTAATGANSGAKGPGRRGKTRRRDNSRDWNGLGSVNQLQKQLLDTAM